RECSCAWFLNSPCAGRVWIYGFQPSGWPSIGKVCNCHQPFLSVFLRVEFRSDYQLETRPAYKAPCSACNAPFLSTRRLVQERFCSADKRRSLKNIPGWMFHLATLLCSCLGSKVRCVVAPFA